MRKIINKKSFRISVGVVFLLLLIISIVPNLYLFTSSDGVVNAQTTTLTSPIEGVLHFSVPVKYGKEFKKGDLIGKVQNDRVNHSFLYELMTEKKMLDKRIESYSQRLERFTKLSNSLKKNFLNYQKYSAIHFQLLIHQEEHNLTEEQAELERAKKEYDANKILSEKNAINQRDLEQSESNHLKSTKRIMNLNAKIDENKNFLAAVKTGAFLGEGHNDSPYSKQRMDQMVIEISLAKTQIDESESRVAGINQQIKEEHARIKQAKCFEIKSPFNSLVWRQPLTEGSTVVIDSELIVLLDCSSVFLDVAVSESQFANIAPGDTIEYRLIGESGYHDGKVIALRGSGTELGDNNLAAILNKDPKKEFRVWVKATPEDLKLSPENFYQVGRRVEVKLPRKWQPFKFFSRLFDVF